MRYGTTFTLLLLTAGLTLLPTGPLRADEAASGSGCNDRLIGIEQRLAMPMSPPASRRRSGQIIDGARTLDRLGDRERCADLADQLDRLLKIF
jgi:hypothetical protein